MPHSIKCFLEIHKNMDEVLLVLKVLSHNILKLKICSVVLSPGLKPACSSAMIVSA